MCILAPDTYCLEPSGLASPEFQTYRALDAHPLHDWLVAAVTKRLREEIGKLRVEINEGKS